MRVLAADDDEGLVRVLTRALRGWGYEATIARDGQEAWQILRRSEAPELAILDWDMPGLSGLEVCRLLRSTPHGRQAYVLMLTGRQHKDDLIMALEAGADDFLSKPFHTRELQLRLAKGARENARAASLQNRSIAEAPPSGFVLDRKYRLENKLAEGGMATVWLGVHLALGVNVAIKFMAPWLAETTDYASFEREAHAAAQLRNDHIVRVYDHGIGVDGIPYLVMEYLAGVSLSERVSRLGPLSPFEVKLVVQQAARALVHAHARGIVHRDVKPENIILAEDPDQAHGFSVKLVDFGLAKHWDPKMRDDEDDFAIGGTPSYMSPEHLKGGTAPNPGLDLWGLATTAFVAMTGKMPFDASSLRQLVQQVCSDPLPEPSRIHPGVPPGFDAWFAKACARDPEERFPNALALSAALDAILSGEEHTAPPASLSAAVPSSLAPTIPDSEKTLLEAAERDRT